jgi:single-strand DNA-binding protein
MSSLNEVNLIGRVGKEPETKYLTSGDALTKLSIATSDKWKDKQTGEQKEATEWHRVTFFGKLAEIAGTYVKKGSLIYIKGSLKTTKYIDSSGVEKYSTEIRAEKMVMLGAKSNDAQSDSQEEAPQQQAQQKAPKPTSDLNSMDDDIPF